MFNMSMRTFSAMIVGVVIGMAVVYLTMRPVATVKQSVSNTICVPRTSWFEWHAPEQPDQSIKPTCTMTFTDDQGRVWSLQFADCWRACAIYMAEGDYRMGKSPYNQNEPAAEQRSEP